jgi:hypothetical protein
LQSTPPCEGATRHRLREIVDLDGCNPRPPARERLRTEGIRTSHPGCNPRPPARERPARITGLQIADLVAIHAPLRGSDSRPLSSPLIAPSLQSTPPCEGATSPLPSAKPMPRSCNPRPPARERPAVAARTRRQEGVAIHAPLRGSDKTGNRRPGAVQKLQSTPPCEGATARR